jgi:orf140b gp
MSEIKNNTKKTEIMEEVSTIDLDKIYSLLLDPEVPAYFIQHKTGISRSVISKLRQGNRKIENLRLGSVVKVQKWLNDSNFYKDK